MIVFFAYLSIGVSLLFGTHALALTGDVNGDGFLDTVYTDGDYVKIRDGRSPSIVSSHYVGRYAMSVHSLQQLDSDSPLEVVVTLSSSSYLYVVDSTSSSASRYSLYRNGATGSADYQIKSVSPFKSGSINQIIVMYPGDNYVWVIDHVAKTQKNYLVGSNPSTFDLVDVDGKPGLDVVLFYGDEGSITIISSDQQRTPFVREYHRNWGTSSTRDKFYGFANTDSNSAMEIILHSTTGGSSIHVIRDSAGTWGYGEERTYNLSGAYQIINANVNRDGVAGNEICYRNISINKYYFLNPNTGNVSTTSTCN